MNESMKECLDEFMKETSKEILEGVPGIHEIITEPSLEEFIEKILGGMYLNLF